MPHRLGAAYFPCTSELVQVVILAILLVVAEVGTMSVMVPGLVVRQGAAGVGGQRTLILVVLVMAVMAVLVQVLVLRAARLRRMPARIFAGASRVLVLLLSLIHI